MLKDAGTVCNVLARRLAEGCVLCSKKHEVSKPGLDLKYERAQLWALSKAPMSARQKGHVGASRPRPHSWKAQPAHIWWPHGPLAPIIATSSLRSKQMAHSSASSRACRASADVSSRICSRIRLRKISDRSRSRSRQYAPPAPVTTLPTSCSQRDMIATTVGWESRPFPDSASAEGTLPMFALTHEPSGES